MPDVEARIQELKNRVEQEPGSRFFVALSEEYRKAGHLREAIATLGDGLVVHPGYVGARIALARAYLEAGRIEESMTAFSKALVDDPSNLVAAKALGDLHLSRGETIEALKRYLRYRGISGDRRLDALIARLQEETAPAVERSPEATPPPPPPFPLAPIEPLSPVEVPAALAEPFVPPGYAPIGRASPARQTDKHDISGIQYERPSAAPPRASGETPAVHSRDLPLDSIASPRKVDEEIVTRKIRLPEANWPFEAPTPPPPPPAENPPSPQTEGRTLADLYLAQGHYAEARDLYGGLLGAAPGDEELGRLRDEAARRADVAPPAALPDADPARERRLAKIRILNEWLAALQPRLETRNR